MRYQCRGCDASLDHLVVDLGPAPLANAFVAGPDVSETFYPLRLFVCEKCFLVQLPSIETPANIFNDQYPYYSSATPAFVEHAKAFVEGAIAKLELGPHSRVMEIASNDGYLLQHFLPHAIPVLGVEPSTNVAAVARQKGVRTVSEFFGEGFAQQISQFDLIVANNVLAHVPDLHDFVEGLRIALAPEGRISIEFPHLLNIIEQTQFDTVYHEHYSYFSLLALRPIFAAHGLMVVDVEQLPTHGGSLRVWLAHRGYRVVDGAVPYLEAQEREHGLDRLQTYDRFQGDVEACRETTLSFFSSLRHQHRRIGGYSAPAKGNTFLNYCGIKSDRLPWTVDSSPGKIGKLLPGSRIPVFSEDWIMHEQPDVLLVLAWNWAGSIADRARSMGYRGEIAIAIPTIKTVALDMDAVYTA